MFAGGFLFARKTAGESPVTLGTDWIVKSARRSEVRRCRPYPDGGFPASSVKIEVGMSTTAPVSATLYLDQPIGWAAATPDERTRPKRMKLQRRLMTFLLPLHLGVQSLPGKIVSMSCRAAPR